MIGRHDARAILGKRKKDLLFSQERRKHSKERGETFVYHWRCLRRAASRSSSSLVSLVLLPFVTFRIQRLPTFDDESRRTLQICVSRQRRSTFKLVIDCADFILFLLNHCHLNGSQCFIIVAAVAPPPPSCAGLLRRRRFERSNTACWGRCC